jgi:hypothetical protein
MIDHVGFSVSDYARSKAFYEKTLLPLGYSLIIEVTAQATGMPAAGFGSDGKPDFWIGGEGMVDKPCTLRSLLKTGPRLTRSTARRWRRAARIMVLPACGRTITRIITGRLCLTPMDTTSRRSATGQADSIGPHQWRPALAQARSAKRSAISPESDRRISHCELPSVCHWPWHCHRRW